MLVRRYLDIVPTKLSMKVDDTDGLKRAPFKQGEWLTRRDNATAGEFYGIPSKMEREREELVADWVGEENKAGVFAALRPQAHSIKNLVDAFEKSVPVEKINLLDRIKADWAEIVGADNAEQCVPVGISMKKLTVEVASSNWMYILKGQWGRIIDKKVFDYTNGEITGVFWRAARRSVR